MTITISVSPQAESKLRAHATASGTDVSRYAAQLVEQALAVESSRQQVPSSAGVAAWDSFVADMVKAGEQLPSASAIDDSRDSIYAGRGE
jgi:hypothetical protein